MRLTIEQATDLSLNYLQRLGFNDKESKDITDNLILAELSDKKTHGLVRLKAIKKNVDGGGIAVHDEKVEIKKETSVSLLIDGKKKTSFHVIKESLNIAFKKIKKSGILAVGLTNTEYASGYITEFARMATKKDLIFIGFNNSPGGLIPFGTIKDLWGNKPYHSWHSN